MDLSTFSTAQIAGAMVFTGLVVVFLALLGLWAIVAIVGRFFTMKKTPPKTEAPPPQPAAPPKSAPAPAAPVVEAGISGSVVAAIAGAVAAMTHGQGVVASVSKVQQTPALGRGVGRRSAWSRAGIQQNTQSF